MSDVKFNLKIGHDNLDQLTDDASDATAALCHAMLACGMSKQDVYVMQSNIENFTKWFASQYLELYKAGKISADQEYEAAEENHG